MAVTPPDWEMQAHDSAPSLQATLSFLSGATPNLTGATVKFIMKLAVNGVPVTGTPKVNAAAVVVDPVAAIVRYDWLAIDADTAGTYVFQWQVTYSGGKVQTYPTESYSTMTIFADLDGA